MFISRRSTMLFLIQTVTLLAALFLAWLLRFDFTVPNVRVLLLAAPVLAFSRWAAMHCYKVTHTYWRYTGIADLKDLLKAVLLGSLLFFLIVRVIGGVVSFPLSIYFIEGVLSFVCLAGQRVAVRVVLADRSARLSHAKVPVLVVGAGAAAALLLRELERMRYQAVGVVDDDPWKQNTRISGVPVLGKIDQLAILAHRHSVGEILIAIPSATGDQMVRITNLCVRAGVPFRAVPGLADLIEGRVTISELRQVNLDDLLGRDPVQLESEDVRERLTGRIVMVTGAAGSIGSELCRQILRCLPKKLICIDQAETPLFELQQRLSGGDTIDLVYSVADITDTERMRQLLIKHAVQVVFHAAAYKHVPLTEANPSEGIKNNVLGLLNLVDVAEECGCEDFLLISSDKAVKPSSLMGCTKRLGEMIVGSRASSRMRCVSVRFGNVLGSQGSVVPTFQEQILTRRRITVTHPEMTRYFMTIPEAVSLVLQAFTVGDHGDILVLDMGRPIRILDLARTLIRISGKRENEIQIVYTGMRPGEKLHEELFYESEVRLPTQMPKVMRAQSPVLPWHVLEPKLQELQSLLYEQDAERIRAKIKQLIPEYQWQPAEFRFKPEVVKVPLMPLHQVLPTPDASWRAYASD